MRKGAVALGLVAASVGVLHVLYLKPLAAIVPDGLPAHKALVVASGALAAAGGVGVLIPSTRRAAGWGLMGWLIAVFPANLWMAQHPDRYAFAPAWMLWARLPLQLPMLWWVWRASRSG